MSAGPLVSIIIPYHDTLNLTLECIGSIRANTACDYELILVDDASCPETVKAIEGVIDHRTQVVRNERRQSFSSNNNAAAKIANGRYLCLLNNDTIVTPGWLESMVAVLEKAPDIGVLGNRHLFPGRPGLHHCGMAFGPEGGHPLHLHPHTDPNAPAVLVQREVPMVTFACVLIPRTFYNQLGGLDEAYRNGYEDCDFCLRARQAGRQVVYTPASTIYHYGQMTPGRTDLNTANWKIFESRWESLLDPNQLASIERADQAFNAAVTKGTSGKTQDGVHFAVDFSRGNAFSWATVELIRALMNLGEHVSVEPGSIDGSLGQAETEIVRRAMANRMGTKFHLKWSHYWPEHMRRTLYGDINAEIFCTNYHSPQQPTGGRDLWSRHVQTNLYRKIAVSQSNFDELCRLGVAKEDICWMPLGYTRQIDTLYPQAVPHRDRDEVHLLVMTNSHDLERYGTDLLVRAVGEAFTPADKVVLHIKDYNPIEDSRQIRDWIKKQRYFPRVQWHQTFTSKEELLRLYADMDALIAPFRGEGFGMKIIDALAMGVPVLLPRYGGPADYADPQFIEELPWKEVPVGNAAYDAQNYYLREAKWCEVSVDAMRDILKSIPRRREELRQRAHRAVPHIRGTFSWDKAAQRLMMRLRQWEAQRLVTIGPNLGPAPLKMSVIIPTKDRPDILDTTLAAYASQSVERDRYELLLVNDHGDHAQLEELVRKYRPSLPLRLIDNHNEPGPAAARNCAIRNTQGEIILITGDDIIPRQGFLHGHLTAHERFPLYTDAVLGQTVLPSWYEKSGFMQYLNGAGGHQFQYIDLIDGREVPFDRFYTSNISLKRRFLASEEALFCTKFPLAAFEDVELGYRLYRKGLRILYAQNAIGEHNHELTVPSFVQRQIRAGRMLTQLALAQPEYVPQSHTSWLQILEQAAAHGVMREHMLKRCGDRLADDVIKSLTDLCSFIFSIDPALAGPHETRLIAHNAWLLETNIGSRRVSVWEALNTFALRVGMAEQWAQTSEERVWARNLISAMAAPGVLRAPSPEEYILGEPHGVVHSTARSIFFSTARFCKRTPGFRYIFARLKANPKARRHPHARSERAPFYATDAANRAPPAAAARR
ncbi:MAG: glycosyltransferase, partial [Proteobacteria bacterium]|nr:glycosyltransferase [Pseudomonadota bacterium]